jgi:hypothetical protein
LSIGACSEQELIMPNWIDEQIQIERFEDMARTAQRDRLAKLALTVRLPRVRFYNPILARLGCWLEVYGYHLQTRYGARPEMAIATDTRGTSSSC